MGQKQSANTSPDITTAKDTDIEDLTFDCIDSPNSSGFVSVSPKSLEMQSKYNIEIIPFLKKGLRVASSGLEIVSPGDSRSLRRMRDSTAHVSVIPTPKRKCVMINDQDSIEYLNITEDDHDALHSSLTIVKSDDKSCLNNKFIVIPMPKKLRIVIIDEPMYDIKKLSPFSLKVKDMVNNTEKGKILTESKVGNKNFSFPPITDNANRQNRLATPSKRQSAVILPRENISSKLRKRSISPSRKSCVSLFGVSTPTPRLYTTHRYRTPKSKLKSSTSGSNKISSSHSMSILKKSPNISGTPCSRTPKKMSMQVSTPKTSTPNSKQIQPIQWSLQREKLMSGV